MRPRQRRPGGASRAARGAATEPQLYVPFLSTTPNSDLRQGAARVPGHARFTASSARAAPLGGGSTVYTVTAPSGTFPRGWPRWATRKPTVCPRYHRSPPPPPLFPCFMAALAPHVEWLARRLRCS